MEGYSTDVFAEAACDFIRRNDDRPFFAYVPFNAAHVPNPKNKRPGRPLRWQAPAEFFRLYGYDPEDDSPEHGYQAVMAALDAGVGRILDQLDESGLRNNTLVILASDNGVRIDPRPPLEVGSNGPFRGGRTTTYEGGIRTASIIRWPERLPAGAVCHEPLMNMDLFVLGLRAAGATAPEDRVIDGRDPLPSLRGEARSPHKSLFFRYRGFSGMRQGRWKTVRPGPEAAVELYDLTSDYAERLNLAAQRPEVALRMEREFESWLGGVVDRPEAPGR